MKSIYTEEELNHYVMEMMALTISDLSSAILDKLKNNITKNTYELGGDNYTYFRGSGEPTYEFLESFQWEEIKKGVTVITRNLVYNWGSMSLQDDDVFPAHKSFEGKDMRRELADLLNFNGISAHKERKEFWEPTLEWVEENIDKLVVKYAKRYGLELTPA